MGDDIYVIAQSSNKILLYFHHYMIFERTTVSIHEISFHEAGLANAAYIDHC